MRRSPAPPVVPTYDRNDVTAPSYVVVTRHGIAQGWCSSEACARAIVEAYLADASAPVLHAWLNPGPDFGGDRADDARRAA